MERILLLISNKATRRSLEEVLSKDYEVISGPKNEPVVPEMLEERFDLAIIDGPTLKRLRGQVPARREKEEPVFLPFLFLTQRRKGSIPVRHLGRTVDDLILRPLDKRELNARIANLLRMRAISLNLKKKHDQVARLSVTDDVSGFHNSRYLHRFLDRFFGSARSAEEKITLVFFDMDNFKHVVDTYGHLLGAKVLKEVAQAVDRALAEEDRIVRYGGDEFVVILPRQGKAIALSKVARMKQEINRTPFLQKENINVHVTASFGLATYPEDAADKKALLSEADKCLFYSKNRGKNRISTTIPEREGQEKTEPEMALQS
jgi:diguanylate cyclase (GGDEF)-like protein